MIRIEIQAENLVDFMRQIDEFYHKYSNVTKALPTEASAQQAAETPKKTAAKPKPVKVAEEPKPDKVVEEPTPVMKSKSETSDITIDHLKAAALEAKARLGSSAEIKQLLESKNISRLSELPPSRYVEMLGDLRALGND